MNRHTCVIPLFFAVVISGLAQSSSPSYPCETTPAIRQAVNGLANAWEYSTSLEERMKPLRALLERYPADRFLQQRYQDVFLRQTNLHREFDAAFAMYRAHPNDPLFRYLEARLTASFDRVKAEEMLNRLIVEQPGFPWAHLAIAEMTDRSGARDAKKALPHLRAFLAACPASVEGYALVRTVEDPEMIRDGAAKLRPLLEARVDYVSMPYWRYLWDLEFRAAPKEQQEAVRQHVLKDAEALKKLPHTPSHDWWNIFDYAVNLTKDEALRAWLEDTVLREFPGSVMAVNVERTQWSREHPRTGRDAKPEDMKAYADLYSARQEELARLHPDDYNVIYDRWQGLSGSGASRPLEERLAIADAFSSMMRRSPDSGSSVPPLPIALADFYVKWRVRLDQVPGLVQAGFQQAELEQKYAPVASMFPAEIRDQRGDPLALTYWRAHLALADLYLYQHKAGQARDIIQVGLANVEQRPLYPLASEQGKRDAAFRRGYWTVRQARLAELEGDGGKALSLYQQYARSVDKQVLTNPRNSSQDIQDAIADAKRAYLASGGKEESWLEWAVSALDTGSVYAGPATVEYKSAMPDFQAKDLSGRTWRLADLKGKTTWIDIWATWCGPCRAEHPELQKLHEAIKGRKDIQLLTFSVDDTAFLAESYMKEQKYSFPVIVSKDLMEKLFPVTGFPQGWIIDAQGRRSSPVRLFDAKSALRKLEEAAAAGK